MDRAHDLLAAGSEDPLGDLPPERLRRGGGTAKALADELRPVGPSDHRLDLDLVSVAPRVGPRGGQAPGAERREEGPLRRHGRARERVVDRCYQRHGPRIVRARLDGEGALPGRREADGGRDRRPRGGRDRQAREAGGREDERVERPFVELPHARVDVAADEHEPEIGPGVEELRLPPRAPGGKARRERKLRDRRCRPGDERVARIDPFRNRGDREPRGVLGGKVLEAVDGEVDRPGRQGVLDLLDEDPLAAGRGKRHVGLLVSLGADDVHVDRHAIVHAREALGDVPGLPERERASPRAENEAHAYVSLPPWITRCGPRDGASPGGSAAPGSEASPVPRAFACGSASPKISRYIRTRGAASPRSAAALSATIGPWSTFCIAERISSSTAALCSGLMPERRRANRSISSRPTPWSRSRSAAIVGPSSTDCRHRSNATTSRSSRRRASSAAFRRSSSPASTTPWRSSMS